MLVITMELWPYGLEDRKQKLAEARIANDGTGDLSTGNYDFELRNGKRTWKRGRVEGFPRKKLLGWDLLCRALYSVLADRNDLKSFQN